MRRVAPVFLVVVAGFLLVVAGGPVVASGLGNATVPSPEPVPKSPVVSSGGGWVNVTTIISPVGGGYATISRVERLAPELVPVVSVYPRRGVPERLTRVLEPVLSVYARRGVGAPRSRVLGGFYGVEQVNVTTCSVMYVLRVVVKPRSVGSGVKEVRLMVNGSWVGAHAAINSSGYIAANFTSPRGVLHITRIGVLHSAAGYSDPTSYVVEVVERSNGRETVLDKRSGTVNGHRYISTDGGFLDYITVDLTVKLPEDECTTRQVYPPPQQPPQGGGGAGGGWGGWNWNISVPGGWGSWESWNGSVPISLPSPMNFTIEPPGLGTPVGVVELGLIVAMMIILMGNMGVGVGGVLWSAIISVIGVLSGSKLLLFGGMIGLVLFTVYQYIRGQGF